MQHQHQQEVEEPSSHHNNPSPSPSFSSYSSETLAEIAARVIHELSRDPHSDDDDALFPTWENENENHNDNDFTVRNDEPTNQNDDDDDFEFEFAFVSRDLASPVSADDIFYKGQIKPMYPIFGVSSHDDDVLSVPSITNSTATPEGTAARRRRLPLRKLMFEEGETASCSSSTDESVDLEGLAEGAYCVWTPNSVGRERKKSNSTGSASKRWRLRDLLLRSHSEGKDKQQQKQQQVMFQIPTNKVKSENGTLGTEHHAEQNKRKSFLPYRPELVGLFTNVNGLGRNFRPF